MKALKFADISRLQPNKLKEKSRNFFLASGAIIIGLPILSFNVLGYNTESYLEESAGIFDQERMAFVQANALVPVADPSTKLEVTETLNVVVTAYSSTVMETDDTPFITASNKRVADGIIANNLLPFGTKIRIPELYGNKIFVVEDRMHERMGYYHFDVWFESTEDAKEFGVKRTYIEILGS